MALKPGTGRVGGILKADNEYWEGGWSRDSPRPGGSKVPIFEVAATKYRRAWELEIQDGGAARGDFHLRFLSLDMDDISVSSACLCPL